MRRWHEDKPRSERQRRLMLAVSPGCHRNRTGMFRKLKAFDCGKSRCKICHWDKLVGTRRMDENVANIALREGIADATTNTDGLE